MYHLSLVLLLAAPLAYCRPAGQHPVMVMMMVPGQHLMDSNAVNGMMQNMNNQAMEKAMSERTEGMMQAMSERTEGMMQQNSQMQQNNQQQEQQQHEIMERVEMMRKMAESSVSTNEVATQSNIAMLEEIMRKMAAMVESMRAMSSTEQVATEQRVETSQMRTSGMEQQISGMVQEMNRMMQTSGGSEQQSSGSDNKDAVPMQMTGGCARVGMFLPAGDNCQFHMCAFGTSGKDGKPRVVPQVMDCSPGMAVAEGYNGGYDNPCTVESTTCGMNGGAQSHSNSGNQGVQRYAPRD